MRQILNTFSIRLHRRCKHLHINRNIHLQRKLSPFLQFDQLLSKDTFHDRLISERLFSTTRSTDEEDSDKHTIESRRDSNDVSYRIETSIIDKGIFHVQLSRASKLNSLDLAMFESIGQTIAKIRDERSIRVVILSGNGKAFCTGLDIKSFFPDIQNPAGILKHMERLLQRPSGYEREHDKSSKREKTGLGNLAQDVAYLWRDLDVPVIAVLHGMCFGGGMQIALGADMRYSTPECKLSLMEAKWGLVPDMSASITLRELISIDLAKELTMTGRIFSGTEAQEMGLVTRVCSDPMTEALAVAKKIVERSPDSVMGCKRLFQECWSEGNEDVCLKKETDIQRELLGGYNMMVASGKSLGLDILPYKKRKNFQFHDAEFYGKNDP